MAGPGVVKANLHPLLEESRFQEQVTTKGLLDCIGFTLELVDLAEVLQRGSLVPAVTHGKERLEAIAKALEAETEPLEDGPLLLYELQVDFQLRNNLSGIVGR